jgi:hypothetical protein
VTDTPHRKRCIAFAVGKVSPTGLLSSVRVALVAGITALFATACASPKSATAESATVSDSAGTIIVVNHRMTSEGEMLLLDSIPFVTIGADEADTVQHFLYPIAARLSDGRIVIGDRGNVWIFDALGKNARGTSSLFAAASAPWPRARGTSSPFAPASAPWPRARGTSSLYAPASAPWFWV